jgi:hypothetical protein
VRGDLAADLDVELGRDAAGQGGEDAAELLGQRDAGPDVLGDGAALDVDGVGHQLAGQREAHRTSDRHAGLLLRLVGRGAEVRRDDDRLELEQRRLGGRLGREHVDAGAGDPALLERQGERVLVDDATARGVDDAHLGLHLAQRLLADEADGLGRLGQVDGDEVALFEQLVQRHAAHAHLCGPGGRHVGVVGDDVHAECRQPLRDEHADAAEPDDADRLLVQLDARVLAALPLAALECLVGRGDVAGGGQQQADGELRGAGDVGGRRVHDHDTGLRGGLDVDVVEADAGAGDDLQLLGGRDGLGVDLGGRADQDRVDVDDGRQQGRAVGAVDGADLEVGPERVDGGGRELFGDEYDGLGHGGLDLRVCRAWCDERDTGPGCDRV